eukprot:TRINITY_DN22525_c0_g1_i5.p1 TRINITY_DN22525_c0_g1~~TRINITY_DN22525_c0_g1_i5.p1  ORF type:complete len:181 (+),score=22.50 TRINITY_DN22525_c0_g1_i5:163-705(+)
MDTAVVARSRRRKSAAERREQRLRAEGRVVSRMIKAFSLIEGHRGCENTMLGNALFVALKADKFNKKVPTSGLGSDSKVASPMMRDELSMDVDKLQFASVWEPLEPSLVPVPEDEVPVPLILPTMPTDSWTSIHNMSAGRDRIVGTVVRFSKEYYVKLFEHVAGSSWSHICRLKTFTAVL